MKSAIAKKDIKSFNATFSKNDKFKVTRNALTISNLNDVATNWDAYSKINHNFSNVVKGELSKVTHQKSSGRCWGFAKHERLFQSGCWNCPWDNRIFSDLACHSDDRWRESFYRTQGKQA